MFRLAFLIALVTCVCSVAGGAEDSKARLIGIQGACENFICTLSEQTAPDVRDLKQQVTQVLADRGYSNAIVEITFYGNIHSANMNINHNAFMISVGATDGKLTRTNLYVK